MLMPEAGRGGPLRVCIVDDEPLARDCVRLALEGHDGVEIAAECGDGEEAAAAIMAQSPDLVFLDVQMPGVDGFGVIERVGAERMPPVVFVTAYDVHAVRAFRVHALDFLLKPFDDGQFADAMARARAHLDRLCDGDLGRRLSALLDARGDARAPARGYATRILARHGDRLEFVPVDTVDWLEAAGNYVRVHAGARAELVRIPLARLVEHLDPSVFVRIHRSAVVNVRRVRALHPWYGGDYTAVLEDGRQLRVSRYYREALLQTVS